MITGYFSWLRQLFRDLLLPDRRNIPWAQFFGPVEFVILGRRLLCPARRPGDGRYTGHSKSATTYEISPPIISNEERRIRVYWRPSRSPLWPEAFVPVSVEGTSSYHMKSSDRSVAPQNSTSSAAAPHLWTALAIRCGKEPSMPHRSYPGSQINKPHYRIGKRIERILGAAELARCPRLLLVEQKQSHTTPEIFFR